MERKNAVIDDRGEYLKGELRSPICCIMGHVDSGKTKLLDCIRGTDVQEGEAGTTYFSAVNIRARTRELKADANINVPGLLVIDISGHESLTNLRFLDSGLCDIAILVVDIINGLEPLTLESLNLMKMTKTEFIVAVNNVDQLHGWKTCRNAPIIKALKQQTKFVRDEFDMRLKQITTQFMEQGLNTELYFRNRNISETCNIVPASAISGESIPDLLLLLVQWSQKTMIEKTAFRNEIQCTVLELKVVEGHGTTIDVVLVNGVLHVGDRIVVCGMQGPIFITIHALLTPHAIKELRVQLIHGSLLGFLKSPAVDIPVRGISIGPVRKKDVMKASVMLEKKKEYATILAFDVTVTPEACEYADEVGVQIFMADIIYHLLEQFKAFMG